MLKTLRERILQVWNASEERKHWPPSVDWIVGIREHPALVMLGANEEHGGETFAVMDVTNGRIVSDEELSSHDIERLGVVELKDWTWPSQSEPPWKPEADVPSNREELWREIELVLMERDALISGVKH